MMEENKLSTTGPDMAQYEAIINPKNELLRWGPIQGRLFFMSEFMEVLFNTYPSRFVGYEWPNTLILMKQGLFLWLNDMEEARTAGQKVFRDYILPEEKYAGLYETWKRTVEELLDFEKTIDESKLEELSDNEFAKLWKDFYSLAIEFFVPTIPAELGNYGSDRLLENALRTVVPESSLASVLEILTAPEESSFYQDEEMDLLATDDVEAHQRKYFWMKNSYAGALDMPVSFFEERKKSIPEDLPAQTEARFASVRAKKREIIEQYHLPEETIRIADGLRKAIEWQDERKKYIFLTIHYKDLLLREVARRFDYAYEFLKDFDFQEIQQKVFTKTLGSDLEARHDGCAITFTVGEGWRPESSIRTVSKEEIKEVWDLFTLEEVEEDLTSFRGIVACAGKGPVQGRVRILLDPRESEGFQQGEVLVTTMTTPEYIFAMKKAVSIITDTGGLTSHAAIVSRELGIPCLVGTKLATQALKDGDLVEVDAKQGIVKIIERA